MQEKNWTVCMRVWLDWKVYRMRGKFTHTNLEPLNNACLHV